MECPPLKDLYKNGVRRVLLLDFDGVVAPLGKPSGRRFYTPDVSAVVRGAPLWWSSTLVKELNSVLARPDTALVWFSSWLEVCEELTEVTGLSAGAGVFWLRYGGPQAGKRQVAEDWLDNDLLSNGVKVAWVDDYVLRNLGWPSEGTYEAHLARKFPKGLLTVSPDGRSGISKWDMSRIVKFMEDDDE